MKRLINLPESVQKKYPSNIMEAQKETHHWCEKQEKLLKSWAERAAGYRWLHNHARLHYKNKMTGWHTHQSL
jgi:hypothetical protein